MKGIRLKRRSVPNGIRITPLGIGYVLLALIVALAATNTGNNALFMVLALMLAVLAISGVVSRQNVRGLEVALELPHEIFAHRPFEAELTVFNRGRWWPRWFLRVDLADAPQPRLIPHLPKPGRSEGRLQLMLQRRGIHRLRRAAVSSLFPFGLFRKGQAYKLDQEVLVYPEIFEGRAADAVEIEGVDEENARRRGQGQGIFQLRALREGDDPRGIHWKQTAKTGDMIFMERDSERGHRLSVLFDNGVGELRDENLRERFEHLVSQAATVALEHLYRGFEVELVCRDQRLPFGNGVRQRVAILEFLALIETCPMGREPLESSDRRAPQVRLSLDVGREVAA